MEAERLLAKVLEASQQHSGRVPEEVYNEARLFLDTLSKNEEVMGASRLLAEEARADASETAQEAAVLDQAEKKRGKGSK